MSFPQASGISWQDAINQLAALDGKECEGPAAARALATLRCALRGRLLKLLGRVDDALNDDVQTTIIGALPLSVLEVSKAALHARGTALPAGCWAQSHSCNLLCTACRSCLRLTRWRWTARRQAG